MKPFLIIWVSPTSSDLKETGRGESRVRAEADSQSPPGTGEAKHRSSPEPLDGEQLCRPRDSGLLTSRTVEEEMSAVSGYQMCGHLIWQPQEHKRGHCHPKHICNISALHTQISLGFFIGRHAEASWKKARSWHLATTLALNGFCTGNIISSSSEASRGEDEENAFGPQGTARRHPHSLWPSPYWWSHQDWQGSQGVRLLNSSLQVKQK